MSYLTKKNILDILSESAEIDAVMMDDFYDDDELDDCMKEGNLDDIFDEFQDFDESVSYTEEMVNVIQFGSDEYLIEHDNLLKYMESNSCSITEAMDRICGSNNISINNTFLLMESKDDFIQALSEAKSALKSKDKSIKEKAAKKIKATSKQLKELKNKGIKVLKKK